ncbi:hypothetical protein FRB95_010647 [Tulasnella sp. JGI-2019a]|nr:hypothetical protein FRB93_013036 [Tulasnella sp. JGI-2019a]KAG9039359.1 hypothetical protein FRB95_010647 [Tulasnella sp. JGI-2019a]
MSDVRALLKAKTKAREPQVQHPLAAYNSSGQLRCTLCATIIKFSNAAAWKSHLDSKVHKTNALRENERKGKRKAENDDGMDLDASGDSDGGLAKKRKIATDGAAGPSLATEANGFPSDFFTDPSRRLEAAEEEQGSEDNENSAPTRTSATIDSEFEAFERALSRVKPAPDAMQALYSRATVMAEPELVDIEALQADGFPPEVAAEGAQDGSTVKPGGEQTVGGGDEQAEEETEAQRAKRKEMEEKELILDRIVDEERAQEAAEEKVTALRTRFEAIKKQREAKKLAAAKKA